MEGGGHASSDERGAEKSMDDYLKSIGLHRKKIAKDGSCLFRAVAEQVLHSQSLHTHVRAKCVEFLKQNRASYEAFIEGDFEDYLVKLQDPQQWVGEVEISALAAMYKRDFLIFQEPGKPPVNITDKNFKDKVQLCFLNGNHYDSVYPIGHIKNSALCQSILYELLYDGVFRVERGSLSVCQRLGRPSDLLSDDSMVACLSSDESDVEADEPLWVENGTSTRHNHGYRGRGRGRQLPERVRRSLNPTLFRNIEYDFWHKTKRAQQKMDYCIAAGMQYTVGDRCQVRHEGRSYNATVKEVPPNSNMVVVHIEEMGKRHVPLWTLRPPSEEGSWSTVVKEKRLSNGHGDWEERGKGRGRGKPVPPSSSGSQAASAAGSGGRVQKQHSWSPQVTVEEQGGDKPKAIRKSVSLLEENLAKEQEERNIAVVEIPLRDEQWFPALGSGTQNDGGKKKGAEKRRSQRNKTKSPDGDVGPVSPSAGQSPKSSPPPLAPTAAAAAAAAPASNTTMPTPPSSPAPPPTTNPAPTCAAPTTKANAPSPSPVTLSTKPPVTGGAPPHTVPCSASVFSFLTPVLPTASTPPSLPASSPPPSSSSLPPKSSSLPLPPPTFIAPIAPSPVTLPPSSLHRASLPHSLSPPSPSSSTLPHHAAQTAPSLVSQNQSQVSVSQIQTQTPSLTSLPQSHRVVQGTQMQVQSLVPQLQHQTESQTSVTSVPLPQSQTSLPQSQTSFPQSQTSLPQSQTSFPQSQTSFPQSQTSLPQSQTSFPQSQTSLLQSQTSFPQSQTSFPQSQTSLPQSQTSLPQSQTSVSHLQPQPQTHFSSQSQSEMVQVQPPNPPPPGPSFPHTFPPQQPHPSLSVSVSPTHPSLQTPPQTESSQPESSTPPPSQQPVPAHFLPTHPPHPPHPQSIPGAVPLHKLSQLYQDPLYPGFPQEEKGDMAPVPLLSSSRKGDDLPRDLNILRFFFNLGVKAFSMPLLPPYFYLLPLQQAFTLQPKPPSRSPSPTPAFPPSSAPSVHQESYAHYPPSPAASVSAPPQYGHPAPPGDTSCPSEPSFSQTGFSVTQAPPHRMPCTSQPWQQHHMAQPTNSYPVGYPSSPLSYQGPPPPQGYPPGPGTGHPLYPPTMSPYPPSSSPYPPSSLAFQSSSTPEGVLMSQAVMEQHHTNNGDTVPGQVQVPGPLEGLAAPGNVANANNSRAVVVPGVNSLSLNEQGESLTRTVLLVNPQLNNRPILTLVSDDPVSMTTMKPSGSPAGSPSHYVLSKATVPSNVYHAHPKHFGAKKTGHMLPAAMVEAMSVSCSTEDAWAESEGFKPSTLNSRGHRRMYRGGARGRGGVYEGGRGGHRRRGEGFNHGQFSSSHRGRGY